MTFLGSLLDRGLGRATMFRFVAICQAATVLITWGLWEERSFPPTLPVGGWLPAFSTGVPVIVSLGLAIVWPRIGTVLHVGMLAYACLLDQARLQPEFVSMAILMVALAFPSLLFVGRAHLVTLWVWAGFHKLLSIGFAGGGAVFIANGLGVPSDVVAWMTPLAEITLGLLALAWATRYAAVALAFMVHGLILTTLVAQSWNQSVWPWNVAIPFAAWYLLLVERDDQVLPLLRHPARASRFRVVGMAAVWFAFWIYPAVFYVGAMDAYLAHNLYTSNTQTAAVCTPSGEGGGSLACGSPFGSTWTALNVPLPPETRLFRQWFEGSCSPGEVLQVSSIQTRVTESRVQVFECPGTR
jgi:hypothetical protein